MNHFLEQFNASLKTCMNMKSWNTVIFKNKQQKIMMFVSQRWFRQCSIKVSGKRLCFSLIQIKKTKVKWVKETGVRKRERTGTRLMAWREEKFKPDLTEERGRVDWHNWTQTKSVSNLQSLPLMLMFQTWDITISLMNAGAFCDNSLRSKFNTHLGREMVVLIQLQRKETPFFVIA